MLSFDSWNGSYGICGGGRKAYSGLMLAARITLPHFNALFNMPEFWRPYAMSTFTIEKAQEE